MQTCPNCGAENKEKEVYCYKCGAMLSAALQVGKEGRPDTHILMDEEQKPAMPKRRWGTARFDAETIVLLHVKGHQEPIGVELKDKDIVLGRSHGDSKVDVDLTDFGAVDSGVSRRHALLRWQNETVVVIDLESANYTYLNGQRIIPNEPRILRDGDELKLGRLTLRATFEDLS